MFCDVYLREMESNFIWDDAPVPVLKRATCTRQDVEDMFAHYVRNQVLTLHACYLHSLGRSSKMMGALEMFAHEGRLRLLIAQARDENRQMRSPALACEIHAAEQLAAAMWRDAVAAREAIDDDG